MRINRELIFQVLCVLISSSCVAGVSQPTYRISEQRSKEFKIEKDLGKAVMSWLADGNDLAVLECDRLADSLLTTGEPTARAYFIAAQVANLREKPQVAISILEEVINKHPDEKAPFMKYPVRIVGRFWIATIAKHSNNMLRARQGYESILSNLGDVKGKEVLTIICNLYLAEIESDHLKRNTDALNRLKFLDSIRKPEETLGTWYTTWYDMYSAWAKYKGNQLSQGKNQAMRKLMPHTEANSAYIWIVTHLQLSGIVASPLAGCCGRDERAETIGKTIYDRIIQSDKSSIDEAIVRFIYGFIYQNNKKYVEAEEHYSQLFNRGTFLSPISGICLSHCKKAQGKDSEADGILEQVRTRYPGYDSAVAELKESWQKEPR